MSLELDPPSEDPIDVVEHKVRELYTPDAKSIVDALGDNPVCVVTGPMRNGKTTNLLPEMERLLQEQERDTVTIDAQLYAGSPLEDLRSDLRPNPRHGVVIIDEAGALIREGLEQEVLEASRELGYQAVVPVIAYDVDRLDRRDALTARWKQVGEEVTGKPAGEIPVVHLPSKLLPPDLAREMVVTYGHLSMTGTTPEAIEYVLTNVPHNPKALAIASGQPNVEQTQRTILSNVLTLRGAIPKAQLDALGEKVERDLEGTQT